MTPRPPRPLLPPHPDWLQPSWPAPAGVRAFVTTRAGGTSAGRWGDGRGGGGLNVGFTTGDAAACVRANRARLAASLPAPPCWLKMVHGAAVVEAAADPAAGPPPVADAAFSTIEDVVCCVTVADCLPVFLCDREGQGVAVAHAGWRGLAAGVIQATAHALRAALRKGGAGDPATREPDLLAWLGPAIGPASFEVGPDVLDAMRSGLPDAAAAFVPSPRGGDRWRADLFALARMALAQAGVTAVSGGVFDTCASPDRFYSFRRDRETGRHAAVIWRSPSTER